MSTVLRRLTLVVILLLTLALLSPVAQAATPRGGETVRVAAGETIDDDAYLFGNTIIVDGTVRGDVVALGQTIIVNGVVAGNLEAAGATVTVNGQVGRSVRSGAYAVTFGPQARVGKDALIGAWSFMTAPDSQIGGDALIGTYQARLEGTIGEDYTGSHSALDLNGIVNGNARLQINPEANGQTVNPAMFMPNMPGTRDIPIVAQGIRIGDRAQIRGSLTYASPVAAVVSPSAQIGGPVEQTANPAVERERERVAQEAAAAASPLNRLLNFVRHWLTLLVVGLLLVWLAWPLVSSAADIVTERVVASLGWGIATLVGTPFLLILLVVMAVVLGIMFGALTLGGLGAASVFGTLLAGGGLLFAFLTAVAWISKIVVGLALGRAIFARTAAGLTDQRWLPMLAGVTLLALGLWLLSFMQYLGGLADLLVTILGLGAFVVALWNRWRPARPAESVTPAAPLPMPS